MKKKKVDWYLLDCIIGIISGILSVFGIFTGLKSMKEQEEMEDLRLEEKYGLTPIEEEE